MFASATVESSRLPTLPRFIGHALRSSGAQRSGVHGAGVAARVRRINLIYEMLGNLTQRQNNNLYLNENVIELAHRRP